MFHRSIASAAALSALVALAGCAAPPPASTAKPTFLCCNVRSDGSWISDSNYRDPSKHLIPLGTPIRLTGYGRYRVDVQLEGRAQELGNDYSRDLDLPVFASRYIVDTDPRIRLATFPPAVRQAIEKAQVFPGMTREQVLMALGPPTSGGTPNPQGAVWRYFVDMRAKFHVVFDGDVVKQIDADAMVRDLVSPR